MHTSFIVLNFNHNISYKCASQKAHNYRDIWGNLSSFVPIKKLIQINGILMVCGNG